MLFFSSPFTLYSLYPLHPCSHSSMLYLGPSLHSLSPTFFYSLVVFPSSASMRSERVNSVWSTLASSSLPMSRHTRPHHHHYTLHTFCCWASLPMTRARLRVSSGTFRWATRPSRQLPDSTAGGVRNPPVPDDTIGQDVVPESSHDAGHSKKVLGPSRGVPVCVRAPVQPWCGLPD